MIVLDIFRRIWEWITDFAVHRIAEPIKTIGVWDVIDILLLAVILYQLYRFTRNRRAGRVLLGLGAVLVGSLICLWLALPALNYIIRLFAASAFFCVIVIFQPEIRDALEHLGNLTLLNPRSNTISRKKIELARSVADETADAVFKMAKTRTGALIVFEGLTKLGDYVTTGKLVDARVTSHLLQNIFYPNAPLHDGALIIRDMKIYAASCVLPSAKSPIDFGNMGMRHRAAVGVTEVSDALVVVISEQTGIVSVAQDGKLLRDVDAKTLTDILMTYIAGNAYLRIKRANMRKEYLEMLEKVAHVEPPKPRKNEELEKEFQKLVGEDTPAEDGEPDSTMEAESPEKSDEKEEKTPQKPAKRREKP